MVSNLDIWRAANQLIREHGAPALISKQHARMFDRGDDEGRLVWALIRRAIEALHAAPPDKPH